MATPNIVPVQLTTINTSHSTIESRIHSKIFPIGNIVDNASDYEVCVEEVYAPVNSDKMPIDLNEEGYTVMLFCDVKSPPDPPIPGLVYGNNFFQVTGAIYSVSGLLGKINDILSPFGLGSFSLNHTTELIEFKTVTAAVHTQIEMYLDNRLAPMLGMVYEPVTVVNNQPFYRFGFKYSVVPDGDVEVQQKFTQTRFYKIRAIGIYTDLPTYSVQSHTSVDQAYTSQLLYQIHYNANSMSEVIDVLVTPQQQLWRSLLSNEAIRSFRCWLVYRYESGAEIPLTLEEGESTRVSFCFSRIHKI